MATDAAQRMKEIVAEIAPVLKAAGFRKRRHSFNRTLDAGVTHVVDFQMGAHDPPGTAPIRGIRENLYGCFTINVGVFAPVMHVYPHEPPGAWVNEVECQMRQRIGRLLPDGGDMWWSLRARSSAETARQAVRDAALPWLDRFPSPDAIRRAYDRVGGQPLGLTAGGSIQIAAIDLAWGERDRAVRRLQDYLAGVTNPHHRSFVLDYARRVGLTELAEFT